MSQFPESTPFDADRLRQFRRYVSMHESRFNAVQSLWDWGRADHDGSPRALSFSGVEWHRALGYLHLADQLFILESGDTLAETCKYVRKLKRACRDFLAKADAARTANPNAWKPLPVWEGDGPRDPSEDRPELLGEAASVVEWLKDQDDGPGFYVELHENGCPWDHDEDDPDVIGFGVHADDSYLPIDTRGDIIGQYVMQLRALGQSMVDNANEIERNWKQGQAERTAAG